LAFRNFTNIGNSTLHIKLGAVLNGKFTAAPFGLPNGPTRVGAAIHVYSADVFTGALQGSGKTAAQYMLDGYDFLTAAVPETVIPKLDTLFSSHLGFGATYLDFASSGPIPAAFSTNSFSVQPHQTITVVFDVTTSTLPVIFADGTTGGSDAYFLDTLVPAPNFVTDDSGNPVAGLVAADTPPASALPATPGVITLGPQAGSSPVGTGDTLTANATDSTGAPLPGAIVRFTITSGPNAGIFGAGTTDATGRTTFSYADVGGAGIDTIQASIGSVGSNVAQQTWQGPSKCPQPQGFWKNNPAAWPVSSLNIGAQTYNRAQLLQILGAPGGADASMILAVQLIAAKLNIAGGANRSPVNGVVNAADELLANFAGSLPFNVRTSSAPGSYMTDRGATLKSYNGGALTSCKQ
jgi:hypothetical protein